MEFKNQTVMVTGAAGNLGRAVARVFAERGANLVLIDLDQERLEKAYGAENAQLLFAAADLFQKDQLAALITKVTQRFPKIDVLCNVAGGFRMGQAVHETSEQDWEFLFDTNTRSLLNTVQAVVPRMLQSGRGKIVNIGANAAQKGIAQMGAYCASKDVVVRLTEAMSAELRDNNINVNCVLPSIIDTPENRAAMPGADASRWVTPEALAEVIAFLASDAARAVHGAALPVTGRS